jgi:hypothetical protein
MATITLDVKQIAPFMAKVIDEFQMATVIALTRCAKAGQKGQPRPHCRSLHASQ